MSEANKIIDYLPKYVSEYKEILEITKAEQIEFDEIFKIKDSILENTFIETADIVSVEKYLKIVGLISNPLDTIDEKKFAIIAKYNEQLPYTYRTFYESLRLLCGDGNFSIELKHNIYSLTIFLNLLQQKNLDTIKDMVSNIVPCNIKTFIKFLEKFEVMCYASTFLINNYKKEVIYIE